MKIECDPEQCDVRLDVEIFELLWRSHARVHVPESVVYKFGKMTNWFFCQHTASSDPPFLKRKRAHNIRRHDVNAKILQAFCAGTTSDDDLVATFVWAADPSENCKLVHLTRKMLEHFLQFMPNKGHGVLQRWAAPFGGRSTLIRTEWSPHHFELV